MTVSKSYHLSATAIHVVRNRTAYVICSLTGSQGADVVGVDGLGSSYFDTLGGSIPRLTMVVHIAPEAHRRLQLAQEFGEEIPQSGIRAYTTWKVTEL
jgi:hypothetical protein